MTDALHDKISAALRTLKADVSIGPGNEILVTKPIRAGTLTDVLVQLVPGLTDAIPAPIRQAAGGLTLQRLSFTPANDEAPYKLDLKVTWTDAPAAATLTDHQFSHALKLRMGALTLLDTGGRVTGFVEATVDVFDVTTSARVQFPSLSIDGFLAPGIAVDGKTFAAKHKLALPNGRTDPSPSLESLRVSVSPKDGTADLVVRLRDLLHLDAFTVDAVEAHIAHTAAGATNVTLWAEATLPALSDAPQTPLIFDLDASYTDGDAAFSATLKPGGRLGCGALVTHLASAFEGHTVTPTLPDVFAHAAVTGLSVSFGTKAGFDAMIAVSIPDLDHLSVSVRLQSGEEGTELSGHIEVDGLLFDVDFKRVPASEDGETAASSMVMGALGGGSHLSLSALLEAIAERPLPAPPLDLTVKDAAFVYASGGEAPASEEGAASEEDTAAAPTEDAGQESTAPAKPESRMFARADLEIDLNIAALKPLGLDAKGAGKLGDVLIGYAFSPFTEADVTAMDAWFDSLGIPALPKPEPVGEDDPNAADATPAPDPAPDSAELAGAPALDGLVLRADLDLGGVKLPIESSTPAAAPEAEDAGTGAAPATPAAPETPASSAKWFQIQKPLGPLYFDKLGVNYADERLWFLLDASVTLGPLSLGLINAGVGARLDRFDLDFTLDGLVLDYKTGDIQIGGGFMKYTPPQHPDAEAFAGTVIVETEILTLSAIGAYAALGGGEKSFFLYAALDYPIGGPPFFFMTGIAGGFGYNRSIRVPAAEAVPEFPFVAAITGGAQSAEEPEAEDSAEGADGEDTTTASEKGATSLAKIGDALTAELAQIQTAVPIDVGEYFFAAGIRFTSFEMIDSVVVLAIEFGKRFEVDVLGLTAITVPVPEPGGQTPKSPIVELQLATKASFVPSEGVLQVRSVLTPNSYLFSRSCRVTGGLAFSAWFGDAPADRRGDVVATIGGYHRQFVVPPYYPRVPRLGFDWKINDDIGIQGDAYFALTPHAVMAGGHLKAVYDSGPLKAWFMAGADFLLSWQPYHYDAEIMVSIGAQLTIHFFGTHHLSVEIGGDLHVWGPDFAGKVRVSYWIFSVTIHFGPSRPKVPPLSWAAFKDAFLPKSEADFVTVKASAGLMDTVTSAGTPHWILNPQELCLEVSTALPMRSMKADGMAAPEGDSPAPFGIGAMGVVDDGATSHLKIWVTHGTGAAGPDRGGKITHDFKVVGHHSALPAAIWKPATDAGKAAPAQLNAEKHTLSLLDRLTLVPAAPPIDPEPYVTVSEAVLETETTPRPQTLNALSGQTAPVITPGTWHGTRAAQSDADQTLATDILTQLQRPT
ncbi:DUF6603 domain-containing protein [Gymnodinialimonas sp.]